MTGTPAPNLPACVQDGNPTASIADLETPQAKACPSWGTASSEAVLDTASALPAAQQMVGMPSEGILSVGFLTVKCAGEEERT